MSITSIGSSFTAPVLPVAPPVAITPPRIVEAAKASADSNTDPQSQQGGERSFPAQLASEKARALAAHSALGTLMVAQEEAGTHPSVGSRIGVAAYGGG